MKQKDVKLLKAKLVESQTQSKTRKRIDLPKSVAGERTNITRVKTEDDKRKSLPEVQDVQRQKYNNKFVEDDFDSRRYFVFKPEPSMPGFNSFSNTGKTKRFDRKFVTAMLTSFLLFVSCSLFAQHNYNPCARAFSTVASIWSGANGNGFTTGLEAGVWGVDQPFGANIGILMTNDYTERIVNGKSDNSYKEPFLDLILRLTAKVWQTNSGTGFHVLTSYATINGDLGGSYRIYRTIGNYILIGVEPNYSMKYGGGVNGLLTFVLK